MCSKMGTDPGPYHYSLFLFLFFVRFYVCTHYTAGASDRMAYINVIISAHLAVFQSLFLSRYILIHPFFPPFSFIFQRFSIFCGWDGEGGEMLKETGERYTEQRVMNLPAVCNTLRFVGSSLVSDPNLMRQDSFSLSPPTHACTHTRAHTPPLSQESCTTPLFLAVCPWVTIPENCHDP